MLMGQKENKSKSPTSFPSLSGKLVSLHNHTGKCKGHIKARMGGSVQSMMMVTYQGKWINEEGERK
jgi:hypothetical protein